MLTENLLGLPIQVVGEVLICSLNRLTHNVSHPVGGHTNLLRRDARSALGECIEAPL